MGAALDKLKQIKDTCHDNNGGRTAGESISRLSQSSLFSENYITCYKDRMTKAINGLANNNRFNINMDIDGDGKFEDMNIVDAIVQSNDSLLDVYVSEKVEMMLKHYGRNSKVYSNPDAIMELALQGIRIDSAGSSEKANNRNYVATLVDVPDDIKELMKKGQDNLTAEEKQKIKDAVYSKDAKLVKDSEGKTGTKILSDCLIPDGSMQGAESNLESILDEMGYDCVTRADFVGRESEFNDVMSQIQNLYLDGELEADDRNIDGLFGNLKDFRTAVCNLWGMSTNSTEGYGKHASGGQTVYSDTDLSKIVIEADNELSELKAKIEEEKEVELENAKLEEEKEEAEKAEENKATAEEKKSKKEEEKATSELLNKKIKAFMKKHEGKKPTRFELLDIKKEVKKEIRKKFKN